MGKEKGRSDSKLSWGVKSANPVSTKIPVGGRFLRRTDAMNTPIGTANKFLKDAVEKVITIQNVIGRIKDLVRAPKRYGKERSTSSKKVKCPGCGDRVCCKNMLSILMGKRRSINPEKLINSGNNCELSKSNFAKLTRISACADCISFVLSKKK